MRKFSLFTLAIALALTFASCENNSTEQDSTEVAKDANDAKFDDTNMEKDTKFAVKAANAGMTEVQVSQLALTNASSNDVKQFAQMMIDDHGKVNEELKATAAQKNITLPAAPDDDAQKMISNLSEKKGKDFDKDYMNHIVNAHEDAVKLFREEANDGHDADLKAWAAQKLPTLEQHLEQAKKIKDALM